MIKDKGYFFLNSTTDPEPISGSLNISDNGMVILQLEGTLPGRPYESGKLEVKTLENDIIIGFLTEIKKHVLLVRLSRTIGGIGPNGTLDRIFADYCVLSDYKIELNSFSAVKGSLSNLKGWVFNGNIDGGLNSPDGKTIKVTTRENKKWELGLFNLKLIQHFKGNVTNGQTAKINGEIETFFEIEFKENLDICSALKYVTKLEELISLINNANYQFGTVEPIWLSDGISFKGTLYYKRPHDIGNVDSFGSFFSFDSVEEDFGKYFSNWLRLCEELGPGSHLFSGVLRNPKLYIEHQFVSLIWGLESMDRRINSDVIVEEQQHRINKRNIILEKLSKKNDSGECISGLNKSQRKYLENLLDNDTDKTLAERLNCVLEPVRFGLDTVLFKNFCAKCATLRNELSHTGGQKDQSQLYSDFFDKILPRTKILKLMYSALLLSHCEVKSTFIESFFTQGYLEIKIKEILKQCDLIEEIEGC